MRCGASYGGQEAGGGGKSSVRDRVRLQIGGRAGGGAHVEPVGHGCDAGGVEAQRLVEHRRGLPRVERGACGTGRSSGQEAGGGGKQCAGEGAIID